MDTIFLMSLMARLVLVLMVVPACASSIYGWQVRTNSTEVPPSFHPTYLEERPVALFPAITMPGLRGNEVGLGRYLGDILHKVVPNWKVVSEQETSTRINRVGLAAKMTVMRNDYEQSNILDQEAAAKHRRGARRAVYLPTTIGCLHANDDGSLEIPRVRRAADADSFEHHAARLAIVGCGDRRTRVDLGRRNEHGERSRIPRSGVLGGYRSRDVGKHAQRPSE